MRIYTPEPESTFPVLLWFHDGGWDRNTIDGNDLIYRTLANETNCAVLSVGYRLAPEHPFPVELEDCSVALSWVASNPDEVLGDPTASRWGKSVGGNLTTVVALLTRY